MKVSDLRTFLIRQFPGRWHVLFALLCCFGAEAAAVLLGPHSRGPKLDQAWAVAFLVAAFFWWLLIAARGCGLACDMAALRLPGAIAQLLETLAVHLTLSVVLPLVVIIALPYPADIREIGGALFLGSTVGFLALSLPAVIFWLMIIGGVQLASWLGWDGGFAHLGLHTAFLLAMALALWCRRLLSPPTRHWWLAPMCQTAADSNPAKTSGSQERPWLLRMRLSSAHTSALAETMGPRLKSLGQTYRWPGQTLTYLAIATVTGGLLWYEGSSQMYALLILGAPALMTFMAQDPSLMLARTPGPHGRNGLYADLLLLPAMPCGAALLPALIRQILRSLTSRMLLLVIPICVIAAWHGFPQAWILWFIAWTLAALILAVLFCLLDWNGETRSVQKLLLLVALAAGIGSSVLIYLCDDTWAATIMSGWVLIVAGLVLGARWAYRITRRRGAPCFI